MPTGYLFDEFGVIVCGIERVDIWDHPYDCQKEHNTIPFGPESLDEMRDLIDKKMDDHNIFIEEHAVQFYDVNC